MKLSQITADRTNSMIDTLSISKTLQEAGDTQEYAETLAGIFRTVFQENAVTQDDIREAFAGLDRKLDDKFGMFGRNIDDKFGMFGRNIDDKFGMFGRNIDDKFGMFGRNIDDKFGMFGRKITGHTLNLFFGLSGVMIATVGVAAVVLVAHLK